MLAALILGELVNVVRELLDVGLLLSELLAERLELLLLNLPDGKVLVGALAALEGVALAAGRGGRTSLAGEHDAGRGEGAGRASGLGDSCAEHDDVCENCLGFGGSKGDGRV